MDGLTSACILLVDDEERNIKLLQAVLHAEGYTTISAHNGHDGMALAISAHPDLILLDIMMPGMDGFETVGTLKANQMTEHIPVIMLTALDDRSSKLRALEAGAEEFLSKPFDRADLIVRVRNLLRIKEYGDFLNNHNRLLESKVKQRTDELNTAYRDTVFTLIRASEHKDEETGFHVRRISHYCHCLAHALNLPESFCEIILQASPMHDVGKIGIPDHILLKPGSFNQEEWNIMRTHCVLGSSILADGSSPYTKMGAEIALYHHERWDGSGYPNGLSGETIPLAARLMQICDVYDALRSRRPYKPPFEHQRAVNIITQGDGRTLPTHFDPQILSCFISQADQFAQIYDQYADA